MATVNEQLLNISISHQVYIEAFKEREAQQMVAALMDANMDLLSQINALGPGASPLTKARLTELYKLIKSTHGDIAQTHYVTNNALKPVAVYESKFWSNTLGSTIPVAVDVVKPSPAQVWAAVAAKPFDGRLLSGLAAQFDAGTVELLRDAVRTGWLQGQTMEQIARRIRGTKASGYTDGIIQGIAGHRARALARTAVQHVAAVAKDYTLEQNEDILKGYQYVATLDSRTTILCASRDGTIYPAGEKRPELPAHWQCRSTYAPVTKSWKELGFDVDDVEPEHRASMDGYVPASMNYEQWLKTQPTSVQQHVLGQRRWELWQAGKPLTGFVMDRTKTASLRTLAEIEQVVDTIDAIPHDISGADEFGARLSRDPDGPQLGGSTGAFMAVDDEGTQWIVKQYRGNALQVQNEYIANRLYNMAGVQVPDARLAMFEGNLSIAMRRLPTDYTTIGSAGLAKAAASQQVTKKFVVDAWLANWDTAGMSFDNMMWQPGKVSTITRIDQGGALLFRAQGTPKGALFGNTVGELQSLRDPKINPASARLFANVTDKTVSDTIWNLRFGGADGKGYIDFDSISAIIQSSGIDSATGQKLYATLEARYDNMWEFQREFKRRERAAGRAATPAAATPGGARAYTPAQAPYAALHEASAEHRSYSALKADLDAHYAKLDDAEQRALKRFTGSYYRSINEAALEGRTLPALDRAIAKLPTYTGAISRGISSVPGIEGMWRKWISGEWAIREWKAYSSCVIHPSKTWPGSGGMREVVIGHRGRNIGGWVGRVSSHPSEAEYLMAQGARFRVVGYAERGSGFDKERLLLLAEVDDPNTIPLTQDPPRRYEWDEAIKLQYDNLYEGEGRTNPGPGGSNPINP